MKKRNIAIIDKGDVDSAVAYWKKKTPEERLSAVEFLREQYYVIQGFKSLPRMSKKLKVVEPASQ